MSCLHEDTYEDFTNACVICTHCGLVTEILVCQGPNDYEEDETLNYPKFQKTNEYETKLLKLNKNKVIKWKIRLQQASTNMKLDRPYLTDLVHKETFSIATIFMEKQTKRRINVSLLIDVLTYYISNYYEQIQFYDIWFRGWSNTNKKLWANLETLVIHSMGAEYSKLFEIHSCIPKSIEMILKWGGITNEKERFRIINEWEPLLQPKRLFNQIIELYKVYCFTKRKDLIGTKGHSFLLGFSSEQRTKTLRMIRKTCK